MGTDNLNAPGRNLFDTGRLFRRLLPVVLIGVLVNLAFSWYASDRSRGLDFGQFSWKYLLLAMGLSLTPWCWHAVRLAIWSRFLGVRVSALNLLRIAVATDVGGAITPTAVGGAPVKMAMLIRQGYTPGKAATLTLLGNAEDVAFFCLAIPVSLLLTRPWGNPLWQQVGHFLGDHYRSVLLILMILSLLLLLLRKTPVFRRLLTSQAHMLNALTADLREATRLVLAKGRKPFMLSMVALTAQWTSRFMVLITVLLALGFEGDLMTIFLLQWMVFIAMLFVPTPGAAGGAEAAFFLVFGRAIPQTIVGAALAGWRFLTYYFMLLVGVGILWLARKKV